MKSNEQETKKVPAPRLRFKQFEGLGDWELVKLKDISIPVTEKVGKRKLTPVSISAGVGFVPQAEKFGRDISGNQYELYTVVRDGEFVFNKGNSKAYPEGAIYLLEGWGEVAAPNVFISFKLKKGYKNDFFKYLFEKNAHGRELRPHITSGARSNGLLNISKETFFNINLPVTSEAEQTHIAACLSSLDAVIDAHTDKLDALRQHKRALMQELFPIESERVPRRRFPEFEGSGKWEEKKLGEVCEMQAGKFIAASEIQDTYSEGLYPCYGGNGLRGYTNTKNLSGKYSLIGRQGALCGNVRLAQGDFYATEHALVVYPKKYFDTDYLYYYLELLNLNQYATGQAQPGLSVDVLKKIEIKTTLNIAEQQRIAACLSSLNDLISAQADKVAGLREFKRGLMQGLFPRGDEA